MPIYQYACPDCGNKFELKQRFTDNPVRKCPRCGHVHVYRVVGQVAVSFKGSGWYITDNRSSSEKKTLEHKPKEPVTNGNGNGNGTAESTSKSTETSTSTGSTEKAETKAAQPVAKAETEKPKRA